MAHKNYTQVSYFILLGFSNVYGLNAFIFFIFLFIYIATFVGNILIIALIARNPRLHTPMYFFLVHLALCELIFTTNIAPNMLYVITKNKGIMTIAGCKAQFYLHGSSTTAECFILTVMSYDRYLAICRPLHYHSIMELRFCLESVTISWLIGLSVTLTTSLLLIFNLNFCGPNIIDHFICELASLLKLSCSDTFVVESTIFVLSIPIIVIPFWFIIGTYMCIFLTILKVSTTSGRKKTFSTCSSHLTSVVMYYGTLMAIYVVPNKGHLLEINKTLYLLYTVVTPLLNPIIYSLRNQEMIKAIKMFLCKYYVK
ncbi:olfactory receptor 11L1-like [Gastrophryne carolinensis]